MGFLNHNKIFDINILNLETGCNKNRDDYDDGAMKWFWTIKITDRCQQLIWSYLYAEQTIHTYILIYYCIVQRNFTNLIRCQTMKVNKEILHI
jgi:hypothetical protein